MPPGTSETHPRYHTRKNQRKTGRSKGARKLLQETDHFLLVMLPPHPRKPKQYSNLQRIASCVPQCCGGKSLAIWTWNTHSLRKADISCFLSSLRSSNPADFTCYLYPRRTLEPLTGNLPWKWVWGQSQEKPPTSLQPLFWRSSEKDDCGWKPRCGILCLPSPSHCL